MSLASRRAYRFGEFTLRIRARVLERDGKPIPLGSKAFEVLTCLVTHAGEVVTKDELLKTVWPESFVEEGNLSQHIFALRKALGDRASYIVTIPGRGYQFTEPVHDLAEVSSPPADSGAFLLQRTRERTRIVIEETSQVSAGEQSEKQTGPTLPGDGTLQPGLELRTGGRTLVRAARSTLETAAAEGISLQPSASPPPRAEQLALAGGSGARRVPAWMPACVVGVALLLVIWIAVWRWTHRVPASQRVVLAELDNRTGDSGFDVVLRNALEIDLDQSPYMDVMSQPEELNILRLMGRAPETVLIPSIAREVCERSNRQVLISGSVASVGQRYLLTLEATECDSGKILAGAKAEASNKEQTLAALDSVSAKLRQGLGESAESLERFQVPVALATTSSLEALKQYSIGEYLLGRVGKEESDVLPFFQRALELDPDFAMASAAIATGYFSQGEYQLAEPYYQKAFDLSGQVSEKERLYIRAHYYADDKGDVRQGLRAYQIWAETYPRDWGAWLDIAKEYSQLGQYDAAIAAGERALKLDSSRGVVYTELARDYMHAGRFDDAEATAMRAASIGRDSNLLRATLFETALLRNDQNAMDRGIAQARGKDGEWDFLDTQALAAAKSGRYKDAQQLFRAAYDEAMSESLPERAERILLDEAQSDFDCGMVGDARAALSRASRPHSEDAETVFAQAELGDILSAQHFLAAQSSAGNSETLMTYVYGPLIRGEIALNAGKPEDAIAALEPALEYDFAGGYATIAERGEAYLRAGQPEQAANEFHKIISHPGIDPVSPLFPLAWLGLARAEAQAGHVDRSRAAYESLLGQWKQADADLPVLLLAHREYASLSAAH